MHLMYTPEGLAVQSKSIIVALSNKYEDSNGYVHYTVASVAEKLRKLPAE